jgi:hypothetical protein
MRWRWFGVWEASFRPRPRRLRRMRQRPRRTVPDPRWTRLRPPHRNPMVRQWRRLRCGGAHRQELCQKLQQPPVRTREGAAVAGRYRTRRFLGPTPAVRKGEGGGQRGSEHRGSGAGAESAACRSGGGAGRLAASSGGAGRSAIRCGAGGFGRRTAAWGAIKGNAAVFLGLETTGCAGPVAGAYSCVAAYWGRYVCTVERTRNTPARIPAWIATLPNREANLDRDCSR